MKIKEQPILFEPYLKSVIWGGNKICNYKGIPQTQENIGESWEISAVPGYVSIVAEGPYKGKSLNDLINEFGEDLLGKEVVKKYGKEFPLLIKIIDANDNLSVQVHPDDSLAKERHNSLGKTEMWYIISADEGAKIYAGLKDQLNPEDYVKRVEEGTFADALATHDSAPGDVFFLPAGRVHAIGAGNLLAEIQESSDITYRIYDYDRRDANGNARELHTDLAKDAIDYTIYDNYKEKAPSQEERNVTLVNCEHFVTQRLIVEGETGVSLSDDSFHVLICLEGDIEIQYPEGAMKLRAGQTVLLPAVMKEISLTGTGTLLLTGAGE